MKVRERKQPIVWAHEGGNPRAKAFKDLEMSIKRAYELNSGLIDALSMAGDIDTLRGGRGWFPLASKDLRAALNYGDFGKEDPAVRYQEVWEWTIEHWYSGALKRSVIAMTDNLTADNKKAIKEKVETLYG
jgi:hypothetical protein